MSKIGTRKSDLYAVGDVNPPQVTQEDDAVYGIPGLHSGSVIYFYRKDLFDAAGLNPSKTWDDFKSSAQKLKELLGPYRNGPCPVCVVYHNRSASCEIELGDEWRISLNDNLLQSLSAWLSEPNVTIVYS